jgi:hypothetical protein
MNFGEKNTYNYINRFQCTVGKKWAKLNQHRSSLEGVSWARDVAQVVEYTVSVFNPQRPQKN